MSLKPITPLGTSAASRRGFLRQLGLGAALFTTPGLFAEELSRRTVRVEEGPFYPPKLPLDTDNDLIIVNDSITPAVGEITHLSGRLLDAKGEPIRNGEIEIWSTDHNGVYLADKAHQARYDSHFQGFGRFLTSSTGEYYFRTLKPVHYGGRPAPHIHFKVKMRGRPEWTTQLFMKGEPGNQRDPIYQRIDSPEERSSVTVEFAPLPGSRVGELAARFDIVLDAAS
jgi:protocatechuate 3,4-dioxygenase beta subunit